MNYPRLDEAFLKFVNLYLKEQRFKKSHVHQFPTLPALEISSICLRGIQRWQLTNKVLWQKLKRIYRVCRECQFPNQTLSQKIKKRLQTKV